VDPKPVHVAKHEYFRAGVGAVIYRADGRVLAFERRKIRGAWQFPQGGLKKGETPEDALFREVEEETGLSRSRFGKVTEVPSWLGYELPADARRKKTGRGQVHKWFLLEFTGQEKDIRVQDSKEFVAWRWTSIDDVAEHVVAFRKPVYEHLAKIAGGFSGRR
jgi:putative (di)nucleoside polyphosphate hydrolase